MVLVVRRTNDDRSVDLVGGKPEISQRMERQQFESVAIVAAPRKGFLERRPMIYGTVVPVVTLRFRLDPLGDIARDGALAFRAELEVLHAQPVGGGLIRRQIGVRRCIRRTEPPASSPAPRASPRRIVRDAASL